MKKLPPFEEFLRFLAATCPAIFSVFLIIHSFKPNKDSAITILKDAQFQKIYELLIFSIIVFMFVSIAINYLCMLNGLSEKNSNTISIYLAAIIVFLIIGRNLLIILTNEQFSLIATFIGLPFLTIVPNFCVVIWKMYNEHRQVKQNDSLDDDTKNQ